jgi:WD40 repeat protein
VEGLSTANCIEFMADGKSIVTGWTDGKLRAFTPQTGKLLYVIDQAHMVKPTKSRELPPAQEF